MNIISVLLLLLLVAFADSQTSSSHTTELTELCPSMCSCSGNSSQYSVNCYNKGLTSIPPGIPSYTVTLYLYYNMLEEITRDMLRNFRNLRKLYLSNNRITTIESSAFADMINLEYLSLSSNRLENITRYMFRNLRNLRNLRIVYNQITTIESSAFADMTNLQTLYLYSNPLTTIPRGTFYGLSNLKELYLTNRINHLVYGSFHHLESLQTLYLYNNRITNISDPWVFHGLRNLSSLDLRDNPLMCTCELHEATMKLKMQRNDFRVQGTCNGSIDLASNTFQQACQSVQTTVAPISAPGDCPSTCSCDGRSGYLAVHCSGRRLRNVPSGIPSRASELSLNNNWLTNITGRMFNGLKDLRVLDLSSNRITTIPAGTFSFSDLKNLETLTLHTNPLRKIPNDAFRGLRNLRTLNLGDTYLESLQHGAFRSLSNLESLILSGNRLTRITDPWVFHGLSNLKYLKLNLNQLACTCELYDAVNKLKLQRRDFRVYGSCDGRVDLASNALQRICEVRLQTTPWRRASIKDAIKRDFNERTSGVDETVNKFTSLMGNLVSAVTRRVQAQSFVDEVNQDLRHRGGYKGMRLTSEREFRDVHKMTENMVKDGLKEEAKKATDLMRFFTKVSGVSDFWINPLEKFWNGTINDAFESGSDEL